MDRFRYTPNSGPRPDFRLFTSGQFLAKESAPRTEQAAYPSSLASANGRSSTAPPAPPPPMKISLRFFTLSPLAVPSLSLLASSLSIQ